MSTGPTAPGITKAGSVEALPIWRNFSWIFLGTVIYGICQWGIIVAIAKLGASWQVGQYALALAITAPVMLLANLQLRQVLATDARGAFHFGDYLSLRLLTSAGALSVIGVLIVVLGLSSDGRIVVFLVATAKAIDSLSDIFFGWLQSTERMHAIGLSMGVNGCISLLASILVMYLTHSVVAVGVASAVGSSAGFLVALSGYSSSRRLRELAGIAKSSRLLDITGPLWSLARLSLPLGAVMFLISLNANVPRYFIQRDLGAGQLGVYAAVGYVLIVGMTLITSVGQAAIPRLAKYYASGDKTAFLKLVRLLLVLGCLLALAAILLVEIAGRDLVLLLYGREYAGNLEFFRLLTLAAGLGFIGSFIGYAVTAARYFLAQAPLYAAAVGVTAVGCALLLPRYGLTGAGWVAVGSAALMLAGGAAILVVALRTMETGLPASRPSRSSTLSEGLQGTGSAR